MHFDYVIEHATGNVIFTGTSDETDYFLRYRTEYADKDIYVEAGLRSYTVEQYLTRES